MYGREGLPLARSTLCGWHFAVAALAEPLVGAMFRDAWENSPYLCTDATGVLVQAPDKCRRGHFFVVVAPGKHVLFRYTATHNGDAVDAVLGSYRGLLVADAHSVYEHLYTDGVAIEVACWAHARRYLFKSMDSDGARARHALALIQRLFKFERDWAKSSHSERLKLRQQLSKPIVEAFFSWCDEESLKVLDETPISKAIGYARNQREALCRFLTDGRLPIHSRVGDRRGGVQAALGCLRRFRLRARVERAITPSPAPASSNRTGGFPASGSPRRRLHIGVMIPPGRTLAFAAP